MKKLSIINEKKGQEPMVPAPFLRKVSLNDSLVLN